MEDDLIFDDDETAEAAVETVIAPKTPRKTATKSVAAKKTTARKSVKKSEED